MRRGIYKWIKTHKYCLWLLYFIFYLVVFFLLEKVVVPHYTIHCWLDDRIPFCKWFVIPYVSWFLLLGGTLGYLMFTSKEDFENLCFLMFNGMTICLLIYALFPNGLALRRAVVGDDLLCQLVRVLYQLDTPSNVCPSIHVSSTIAINEVIHHSKRLSKHWKICCLSTLLTVLISLATLFIKQHSVIDVICGILLSQALSLVTYRFDWRRRLAETKLKSLL